MRRYNYRKIDFKRALSSIVIVFLIFLVIHIIDVKLRPTIWRYAEQAVCEELLKAINDSVIQVTDQNNIDYNSFSKLSFNNDGTVSAVDYDYNLINKLRISYNDVLLDKLSKLKKSKIKIPIGDFFDNLSFSGRGPNVKIKLSKIAYPNISFASSFTDCGINQTKHEIRMMIDISARIYLLPESYEVKFSQEYVLAQTIIVGDIPQGYFSIE